MRERGRDSLADDERSRLLRLAFGLTRDDELFCFESLEELNRGTLVDNYHSHYHQSVEGEETRETHQIVLPTQRPKRLPRQRTTGVLLDCISDYINDYQRGVTSSEQRQSPQLIQDPLDLNFSFRIEKSVGGAYDDAAGITGEFLWDERVGGGRISVAVDYEGSSV